MLTTPSTRPLNACSKPAALTTSASRNPSLGTAVETKGRGRLRVVRELLARGVDKEIATEAVAEVFGEKDERSLVARALQKKLRGRPRPADSAEYARLYQYLMRQGFSPAVVVASLRRLRRTSGDEVE